MLLPITASSSPLLTSTFLRDAFSSCLRASCHKLFHGAELSSWCQSEQRGRTRGNIYDTCGKMLSILLRHLSSQLVIPVNSIRVLSQNSIALRCPLSRRWFVQITGRPTYHYNETYIACCPRRFKVQLSGTNREHYSLLFGALSAGLIVMCPVSFCNLDSPTLPTHAHKVHYCCHHRVTKVLAWKGRRTCREDQPQKEWKVVTWRRSLFANNSNVRLLPP